MHTILYLYSCQLSTEFQALIFPRLSVLKGKLKSNKELTEVNLSYHAPNFVLDNLFFTIFTKRRVRTKQIFFNICCCLPVLPNGLCLIMWSELNMTYLLPEKFF